MPYTTLRLNQVRGELVPVVRILGNRGREPAEEVVGTYGRSYKWLSQPLFIGWRGAREVRSGCKVASVEG